MKAVIVGCGRVGAALADELDRAGWQVLIIDLSTSAFDRLPSTFKGIAQRADGTDEDALRQHGASDADLFLALTEGDNRNVMAAQLAIEALGARRCVAKINDPVRAEAYAHLGHRVAVPDQPHDVGRARPTPARRRPRDRGSTRRSDRTCTRATGRSRLPSPTWPRPGRSHPIPHPRQAPACPARRADRCSCSSWVAARSATT